MSNVIEAAAMRCRTMADGSLRIEVEIEPAHATTAFTLFGRPGAPMALAALRAGYAQAGAGEPTQQEGFTLEPPRSGLARLAALWCKSQDFRSWLYRSFPFLWREVAEEMNGPANLHEPDPEDIAAEVIRRHCGVESRGELDTNEVAARQFNEAIRLPYRQVLERG